MREPSAITRIRRKYRVVAPELDERRRRQWAAAETREVCYWWRERSGARDRIGAVDHSAGVRDLGASRRQRAKAADRIRGAGAGRRRLTTSDPDLLTRWWRSLTDDARRPGVATALGL